MVTTSIDIENLIRQFENGTLPKKDWSHISHLRVALYYVLTEKTEFEAISKMRCGIIRYGQSSEEENKCPEKYSETITVFWMFELKKFAKNFLLSNFEKIEKLLLESDLVSKDYIFKFYSRETIGSPQAKAVYIEPDK